MYLFDTDTITNFLKPTPSYRLQGKLREVPAERQFISTIKDSAIVSVISIQELTFQGMELMSATYLTFECWIVITALYLVLTLSLSLGVSRIEIRMKKSEA